MQDAPGGGGPRCSDGGAGARRRGVLLAILLVAFGIRVAYSLLFDSEPHRLGGFDGTWYDRVARDLVAGEGVRGVDGKPTAFFPPGYPVLLACAYALLGPSYVVARVLNCLLATGTCLLTYLVGRRAYGERVGLMAAGILALFPGDVFYASLTLSEVSFSCGLTACIYAFLVWNDEGAASRGRHWVLFGVLLGLTALVRGIALLYLAVPIVIWLVALGWSRATLGRVALVALGLTLTVAPWTIRNGLKLGYPILIASDGPSALFIGHSPVANGAQSMEHWNLRLREYQHLLHFENPRSEVEFAKADLRYGLRYMLTHPRRELSLIPKRLFHVFRHDHYALQHSTVRIGEGKHWRRRVRTRRPDEYAALSRFADAFFFVVLGLGLAGTTRVFSSAARRGLVVPLTILFFLLAHGIVFWGDPRFHAPFVPMLAVLASVAVDGRQRPWTIQPGPSASA